MQPLGDRAQQPVAERVAERVVDRLEVVEVQHHHRDPPALAPRLAQRLAETIEQQGAVRQAGQRVVMRQVPHPLLDPLALGDVEQHELGRRRAALAGRHRDRLDLDGPAVRAQDLLLAVRIRQHLVLGRGQRDPLILRLHQGGNRPPDQVGGGLHAEQLDRPGVRERHQSIAQREQRDRARLDQATVAFLAVAQRLLGRLELGDVDADAVPDDAAVVLPPRRREGPEPVELALAQQDPEVARERRQPLRPIPRSPRASAPRSSGWTASRSSCGSFATACGIEAVAPLDLRAVVGVADPAVRMAHPAVDHARDVVDDAAQLGFLRAQLLGLALQLGDVAVQRDERRPRRCGGRQTRSQRPSASWRSNGSPSRTRLRSRRSATQASSRPTASGRQPDAARRRASSAKRHARPDAALERRIESRDSAGWRAPDGRPRPTARSRPTRSRSPGAAAPRRRARAASLSRSARSMRPRSSISAWRRCCSSCSSAPRSASCRASVVPERSAPPACGGDLRELGRVGRGFRRRVLHHGRWPDPRGKRAGGVSSSPGAMAEVTRARRPVAIGKRRPGRVEPGLRERARPPPSSGAGRAADRRESHARSIASCSASKRATAAAIEARGDPGARPHPPAPGRAAVAHRLIEREGLEPDEAGERQIAEPGRVQAAAAVPPPGRAVLQDQSLGRLDHVAGERQPVEVRDDHPPALTEQTAHLPSGARRARTSASTGRR